MNWETVSAIAASPRVAVLRPGNGYCRILFRSNDKTPFRITQIECDVRGVQARAVSAASSLQQLVEVRSSDAQRSNLKSGSIAVFTDHPAQSRVDLRFTTLE